MAQPNMFKEIISTLSMGKQINKKVNVFDRIDYFKIKWSAIFCNIHAKVAPSNRNGHTRKNPGQYTFIL